MEFNCLNYRTDSWIENSSGLIKYLHESLWKRSSGSLFDHLHLVISCLEAVTYRSVPLTFEFFSFFNHEHGMEQTILVSIYLLSVVLYIFNVCHWKQYCICSLGVNFLQNSCWYHDTHAANSFLQLTWTWLGQWFPSWATHWSSLW